MVKIKSTNEIILNMLDHFKITIPDADTKPGTVIRDLIIDAPANQLSLMYDELANVSNLQSLRLVTGVDLDNLAKNYGLVRKQPFPSSGTALLTFSSLPAPIGISKGALIYAYNGYSFQVLNGISLTPDKLNYYASIATQYQNDLDYNNIKDQFAIEITLQSTTPGSSSNIGKYSLNRTNIVGINNVLNVSSFSGGTDQETDDAFRTRILSLFNGSSVGTALGYKNIALSTSNVLDCYVVQPNNVLMTRDGTITQKDSNGTLQIISEGTGGKVDVIVYGQNLSQNIDTFIYQDKSNLNDPTNSKNDIVLGQISGDENKTINRRRVDNIANNTLPSQPVKEIIQVTGSLSGISFLPKSTDAFGRVSGNYELIKDTGSYGGSPWGFDKFHWISNKISGFQEDKIKNQYNGQDALSFTDVISIPQIRQNVSITNENSNINSSDRSIIQLLHYPANNVTRVFNLNTGERYTVINQNLDNTGALNTTGRIKISGNTLPSPTDTLQVDYTWSVSFDQYIDYDGKYNTKNLRPLSDSVDWSYSNLIRNEKILFTKDVSSNFFNGVALNPVFSVISANIFTPTTGTVYQVLNGIYAGRLAVNIQYLENPVNTVDSMLLTNSQIEVYSTTENNGTFINSSMVVGPFLKYASDIILPTDTVANAGDHVTIYLNNFDCFNINLSTGSVNGNKITIPASNINTSANNIYLNVSYIASVQDLFNTSISNLPISRSGNGFVTNNNTGFTNTNIGNTLRKENNTVQLNLSNQHYIELSIQNVDINLLASQVFSVIRLSDFKELWNSDNLGSVTINNTNQKYQIILNGLNSPATNDKVLVLYYATDLKKIQPFTYQNSVITRNFDNLQYNPIDNTFILNIRSINSDNNLTYEVFESNSDVVIATGNDGYIVSSGNASTVLFASLTESFINIKDLLFKKIKISNSSSSNNDGIYDIIGYNSITKQLTITNILNHINYKQISVIRLADGQDLWSSYGTIDLSNNILKFPASQLANPLDPVMVIYYDYKNIKQSPTRLVVNVNDQVNTSGTITFEGTTLTKVTDFVFTATADGLKQNLLSAIINYLGLSSESNIPDNIILSKIAKLENVNTYSITSNEVITVNSAYDIFNSTIKDNTYFINDMNVNPSLNKFDFILPSTINNINNAPKIGDRLRVTFYYSNLNDSENVSFTRNGTLYTNKLFSSLNKAYVASGFNFSQSAKIGFSFFNQPISNSRYKATYDYIAPKQNERIVINYNYNKLITDVTFNIENNRPINADVVVKSAEEILIDLTMNVIISNQYLTSSNLVIQNLKNTLLNAINTNNLGGIIDQSDLINAAYTVSGIDRVRVIYFNITGNNGQVLSISAQNNQYFSANNIIVNQEYR